MKKLIIILSIGWTIALSNTQTINAQAVSVNINLDIQPAWGPSGYQYASFYYIPALNIYYDINNGLFIYLNGRRWIANHYLPKKYGKYDLYLMHKVVLNNIYNPWTHNKYHKRTYAHFRNSRSQTSIYYVNDHHQYHRAKQNHWAWVEPRYMPTRSKLTHKHLEHKHQQAQFNKKPYRPSAINSRSTPSGKQNQIAADNRSSKQNRQPIASRNRIENRAAGTPNRENKATANKRNNEVSKNGNKQIDKSKNNRTKRDQQSVDNNSTRTESKSANIRKGRKGASVEKRSEKKEIKKNNSRRSDGSKR